MAQLNNLDKGIDSEKVSTEHVERFSPTQNEDPHSLEQAHGVNEKAVIRKTDLHLVPWLALLYLLSFLDRTNIGNANLFGLSQDLQLTDTQYSACLAVFFAFYVLFEVPSNMVLKRWRPSMWIPLIMVAWGGVMTGMGFVKDFKDLLICRVFLGITEAGLFPGVSYYLTLWYRRFEINFRIALFFSAATIAGAFGGLLARVIHYMEGIRGYEGWRWIFILEGAATIVIATASFWVLYDYPDTAGFLSPKEKQYMHDRLALDNDGCSQEFKYKFVRDAFLDWKSWLFAAMFHTCITPLYCFSLFSPTLAANLGYTATRAQLMSVPPYIPAAIVTVLVGWLSDKYRARGVCIMVCSATGVLGFTLLISSKIAGAGYTGLFLAASGVYPLVPLIVSWASNCMGGSLKKGVGMAICISFGNAGGILSSFIYPKSDKPRYFKGHAICLAYCAGCFMLAFGMRLYCKHANRKKDERLAARGRPYTEEEKLQYQDDGDHVDWFKYSL